MIRQEAFFALMQQNEKQKMCIRSVTDALSWCFIVTKRMVGNERMKEIIVFIYFNFIYLSNNFHKM